MRSITIRELHMKTGHYVRSAQSDPVVVTERGKMIAILHAISAAQLMGQSFPKRSLKDLVALHPRSIDSTRIISEDRDRE
jgi:prevent-host-death family protein